MKIVGITPSTSLTQTFVNTSYLRSLTRPGVCAITLPQFTIDNRETMDQEAFEALHADRIAELTDRLDALCVSGGVDISPPTFGETNYSSFGCDSERDMMELTLVKSFLTAEKPILGVCRGFQLISMHLGMGHFQQDVSVTGEAHNGGAEPYSFKDRQEPMHAVDVFGTFRDYLRDKTGRPQLNSLKTNSFHHQAVTLSANGKRPKLKLDANYWDALAQWRAAQIALYEETYDVNILASTQMVIEGFEREAARLVCFQHHVEEAGPTGLCVQYWLDRYVLNDD